MQQFAQLLKAQGRFALRYQLPYGHAGARLYQSGLHLFGHAPVLKKK